MRQAAHAERRQYVAAGGAAGTGQNNKKIAAEKRLVTFQRGIGYISEIKTKNLPIYVINL